MLIVLEGRRVGEPLVGVDLLDPGQLPLGAMSSAQVPGLRGPFW